MDDISEQIIDELGILRVKLKVPLSDYVVSKIGGPGQFVYMATTQRELIRAISIALKLNLQYLIVGTGSKIQFGPDGFDGLVIKNRVEAMRIFGIKGKISSSGLGVEEAMLEAESGATLSKLSQFAELQHLTGIESLAQMPGSVGGELKNLQILSHLVTQVKVLNPPDEVEIKQMIDLESEDIILSIVLKLQSKR